VASKKTFESDFHMIGPPLFRKRTFTIEAPQWFRTICL